MPGARNPLVMQTWRDRDVKEWHPECRELYGYLVELGIADSVAHGLVDRELLHWSKQDLAAVLSKVPGIDAGLPKYTIPPRPSTVSSSASSFISSTGEAFRARSQQIWADASKTELGKGAKSMFSQLASSPYGQQLGDMFSRTTSGRTVQGVVSPQDAAVPVALSVHETWIKPPPGLMRQSAEEGKALCVDRLGCFSLRDSGFFAISHVWIEGIQGDSQNRGLPRHILDAIFDKMQVIPDVQWIWLDVVAIPTGDLYLNATQELEKIDIINSLAQIYQNAEAVVVFDALALQMRSREPIDVAIALLCGRWMTRVWTFQEIKLASKVIILTAQGPIGYKDMLSGLQRLNGDRSWKIEPSTLPPEQSVVSKRYRTIYMALDVLELHEQSGCSIPDVAWSCRHRQTGNEIDYVRALFPMLGLRWRRGMTKQDGLRAIYEARSKGYRQAAQIMTMFGRPRTMNWPGWAPDDLCGLTGDILYLNTGFEQTLRGLVHEWHALRITSMVKVNGMVGGLLLNLQRIDGTHGTAQCGMFHCAGETEATLTAMMEVVSKGEAYFLTQDALKRRQTSGLFVEKESTSEGWYAYAYAVLRVEAFDRVLPTEKMSWTIRNENPVNDDIDGGRKRAELFHWLATGNPEYNQDDINEMRGMLSNLGVHGPDADGRTLLHKAADAGDDEFVRMLIERGANVHAQDHQGSTPLIYAANRRRLAVIKTLINAGAEVNHNGRYGPALTEAVLSNSVDCAQYLLETGASVNGIGQGELLWPLIHASNNAEITALLLKFGADPNKTGPSGLSALHFAARNGNAETTRLLLEAGAEPSKMCGMPDDNKDESAVDPLRYAIQLPSEAVVAELLGHGADPNAVYEKQKSPLICAAQVNNPKIIEMLLITGADVHRRATGIGTALDVASASGRRLAVKILTERSAS